MTLSFPVRWGEMDAFGHVNNALYFRYLEESRIHFYRHIGYKDIVIAGMKEGPILAFVDCQFIAPVVYPDHLTIGLWVDSMGETSITMYHEIFSEKQQQVTTRSKSITVLFDYLNNQKISIPASKRELIEEMHESSDFPL